MQAALRTSDTSEVVKSDKEGIKLLHVLCTLVFLIVHDHCPKKQKRGSELSKKPTLVLLSLMQGKTQFSFLCISPIGDGGHSHPSTFLSYGWTSNKITKLT